MEFCEKLQLLRKQNGLTQEQLAGRLFVSRTAVSKWESGRGYPNLESLKDISRLFSVSVDELLSNDELIVLAETEKRSNAKRTSGLVFGVLDVITAVLLFLPIFGQLEDGAVRSVALLAHMGMNGALRIGYVAVLLAVSLFGLFELWVELMENDRLHRVCLLCSVALYAGTILLFALSRQPYATALLFLLFLVKAVLLARERRT